MKRLLASIVALALAVLSPGLPAYAAAGKSFGKPPTQTPRTPVPPIPRLTLPGTLGPQPATPGSVGLGAYEAMNPGVETARGFSVPGQAPNARENVAIARVLQRAEILAPGAQALGRMGAGEAHTAGQRAIDAAVGYRISDAEPEAVVAPEQAGVDEGAGLGRLLGGKRDGERQRAVPAALGNGGGGGGGRFVGFLKFLGYTAAGAATTVGIQAGGAWLVPAVFGFVPAAAVWAVASGVLVVPAALYARWVIAGRDSPRLKPVKAVIDLALGAYAGALFLAWPALGAVLSGSFMAAGLTLAAVSGAASLLSFASGGRAVDVILTGVTLNLVPVAYAAATTGTIALGPLLGLAALPVMTGIAFLLKRLVYNAETGTAFSASDALKEQRLSFTWVMTGVVFALLTGYNAPAGWIVNVVFGLWMLTANATGGAWQKGEKLWKNILAFLLNFNVLYMGTLIWSAATGFASPLTFLVLAFLPERLAHWSVRLFSRLLPASPPAFSSRLPRAEEPVTAEERWPRFFYWTKTISLLALMAGLGFGAAAFVYGAAAFVKSSAVAAALAAVPFFASRWLVKKLMRAEPTDKTQDPEFVAIMEELLEKINRDRAAKGKKPVPLPELVSVPMGVPNAFATGRSPFQATVGVTEGIKELLLEPESVRVSLLRLIAASDPANRSYHVFRKAIAGSVAGVPAQAGPRDLSQAVARASTAELKALGTRMLRGVLAHEFSHVMDRHMLSGSLAAAISSAVAFASYGVMWAVGHAKLALDKLLGRSRKEDVANLSLRGAAEGAAQGAGAKPQAFDPFTIGIAMKSLPALLKVFAALWGPVILQVTQMAASRNNEFQADEDGGKLSEDPESLALALGLLMTWRPRRFSFEAIFTPRLAAISHLFTVNPLLQMKEAEVLPQLAPFTRARGNEGFLSDLFVTHPKTVERIRRLWRMAEALDPAAAPAERAQPPPALSPPSQADASGAATAPAESRGASFIRRLSRLWRVLPQAERNRQFWRYTWGQALINIGVSFHYSALGKLLAPTDDLQKNVTDNRAVNNAAQLVSNFLTGGLADRYSAQKLLVWTSIGRSLLLVAVPALFFNGLFMAAIFHLIIFGAAFLQSAAITAGSVAFNRIVGDAPPEDYNRANAVYTLIVSAVGVLAPLLAGAFIVAASAALVPFAGNALAYAVYAAMLGLTALVYWHLRVPEDAQQKARQELAAALKGRAGVRAVLAERTLDSEGRQTPVLLVSVSASPVAWRDVPEEFAGYAVRTVPHAGKWRRLIEGFRVVFGHRFLALHLVFTTLSMMLMDPILFSGLPAYIKGTLGVVGDAAVGAAFTWYMAASSLGTGLALGLMMFLQRKTRASESDEHAWARLERQGRWTSILHGLGWLAYLGALLVPSLWASLALVGLGLFLQGPAIAVWSSLVQKVLLNYRPESLGRAYAAMSFYQIIFAIAGPLLFGLLPTAWVLPVIWGGMGLMALMDFIEPSLVFPIRRDTK